MDNRVGLTVFMSFLFASSVAVAVEQVDEIPRLQCPGAVAEKYNETCDEVCYLSDAAIALRKEIQENLSSSISDRSQLDALFEQFCDLDCEYEWAVKILNEVYCDLLLREKYALVMAEASLDLLRTRLKIDEGILTSIKQSINKSGK